MIYLWKQRAAQVLVVLVILAAESVFAATFYIDSSAGNDSNAGTNSAAAWLSLAKVNATTFVAGDSILFKAGGSWTGQLNPKGSGATNNPIVVDKYGSGAKPLIDGNGGAGNGAVYLFNQSFWEIANLEVVNGGTTNADRRGIYLAASNSGTIHHLYVRNCDIHHIRGFLSASDGDTAAKRTAGILVEVVDDTPTATRFNNILIEGCNIYSVTNEGIVAQNNKSSNSDYPGTTAWEARKITSLVIRNNTISDISKNAIIVRGADESCVIERNVCCNTATSDTGNTMFTSSCRGTVFQYNEGYLNRAGTVRDGSLYDADLRSPLVVFQYSYSHDNSHGLFWQYPAATGGPNTNVVVRYNISRNDQGNIFSFSGDAGGIATAYIYNNTIYAPTNLAPRFYDDRSGVHTNFFYNNIFYNLSTNATYDFTTSSNTFDYNIFYGQHPTNEPSDAHKLTSDPLLVAPGSGTNGVSTLSAYKLRPGSPAIASGFTISTNFIGNPNIGGYDFFSNAVSSAVATDRGAHQWSGGTPPGISVQPQSRDAAPGVSATFSVTAGGTANLVYQWRKNGTNISNATNTSLAFSFVTTNDAGSYSVVITNDYDSVTSAVAALTVVNPNDYIATRFAGVTTTSGVNYTTVTNFYNTVQNLALDVYQPTGDTSTNRPTVMWIHGGGLRTGSSKTQGYIVTYATEFAKRGYVCFSIDYRLRNGTDMPTTEYELPAEQDAAHDANTALAWIRANAATYKINTHWMFVGGGSAGGFTGCVLNFHEGPDTNLCFCASAPTNGVPNNAVPFTDWNRSGVMAFADLWGSPESPKRWYVVDSNDTPTTIIHGTADTTVPYTNSTALHDSMVAAGLNHYLNPITGANHTPTTYNSTIIPWVANFFAREWNKKLCLTPGVDAATQAASSLASSSATLNAALISANATTQYYFEYGTTTNYGMRTVTNTVAGSVNTTNVSAAISGLAASTLHHFRAGISNAAGTQVSTDATFTTASAGPTPPGISAQPQSQPVCAGNNVSFAVTATGSTPFSYQWSKGTAQISNATNSTLAITGVTAGAAANYSVVITNASGSATSSVAVLTVNSAPGISAQPQNATNNVGTSVTFSVTTGGAAPLTYQWRKGGSNVSGTTNSSYTITNVARGDAGNYDVVITNACGAVTSSAATLSVNGPASVTGQPQNVTTNEGASVTFSVTADGTVPLAYQWRKAATPIASATNSTLVFSAVTNTDAGSYSVVVTNAFGSVTSSVATLTVTVGSSGSSTGSVVIAEVYNGGGKTGATYNRDYVVLKNAGNFSVTLSNWSLQHDKANVWQTPFVLTNHTIPAGGYFLIQCYFDGGTAAGSALVPDATAPQTSTWNLSTSTAGAVALVDNTNTIASCASNSIVDLVGYIATASNCYEGAAVAPGGNATQSIIRAVNGCQDSNDNAVDLALGTPTGRNSATALSLCCVMPTISSQPAAQTVVVGGNVSFSVAASGTAPLNYQWRKSGAAVSGATSSSLAFTASAVSDAGDYGVVITNSCGSVTSSAATLTVNKSTPALSVTSTQNPSGYLTALIFSTTAGGGGATPTGTVQFRTNGAVFGSAATLTAGATSGGSAAHLPRGTNTIAAEYSGDSNYLPATNTLSQVVSNHPPGASAASFARGLTPFQIPTSALAGHWSDVDGDTVSIEGFDLTSTNGVVCSTNSTTLFYANASPVNDRLNYTVRDSYGDVSPGVILFTMQPNTVGRGISLNFSNTVTAVQFSAVPGWTYGVQRSTNLASWLLIDTLTAPTNGLFEVLDDYSDTGFAPSSGFYRLIVP